VTETELIAQSQAYLDRVFWTGAGSGHSQFLDHLEHDGLREAIHRCHLMQADTRWLSVEDNYLIGMCVLYAQRCYGPAGMFARTLLHKGVAQERILEAAARLSMWIGPIPAAEAAGHLQKALADYAQRGPASLQPWLPAPPAGQVDHE
jgi:alkylhydroperoxidase/carboxymuconolactone decarboxylase family protein YurZ